MLIPGKMSGEWLIHQNSFDERYLADASTSIAEIYLETAPSTADWRGQMLRWVHPEASQTISDQFDDETQRIIGQKLSSAFAIKAVAVNLIGSDEAVVRVTGYLTRFVTDKTFAQNAVVVTINWRRDDRGAA